MGAGYNIDPGSIVDDDLLLLTNKSMGNGLIDYVRDIIFLEPEKFDRSRTIEMASEIERINEKMLMENRRYVLIGPGRWGTKDKYIGIPVVWPQISNARVIVEVSLPDFHIDASLGSHFFHNVTSMNVGYFSIDQDSPDCSISWGKLNNQTIVKDYKYFRHVQSEKPLLIRMDGRKGLAVISMNQ